MTAHVCRVCGARRRPGGFLVVSPVAGEPYHVCRPSVSGDCFRRLGLRRDEATIAIDDEAAKEYDLERAAPLPDPVATAIREAEIRGRAKDINRHEAV